MGKKRDARKRETSTKYRESDSDDEDSKYGSSPKPQRSKESTCSTGCFLGVVVFLCCATLFGNFLLRISGVSNQSELVEQIEKKLDAGKKALEEFRNDEFSALNRIDRNQEYQGDKTHNSENGNSAVPSYGMESQASPAFNNGEEVVKNVISKWLEEPVPDNELNQALKVNNPSTEQLLERQETVENLMREVASMPLLKTSDFRYRKVPRDIKQPKSPTIVDESISNFDSTSNAQSQQKQDSDSTTTTAGAAGYKQYVQQLRAQGVFGSFAPPGGASKIIGSGYFGGYLQKLGYNQKQQSQSLEDTLWRISYGNTCPKQLLSTGNQPRITLCSSIDSPTRAFYPAFEISKFVDELHSMSLSAIANSVQQTSFNLPTFHLESQREADALSGLMHQSPAPLIIYTNGGYSESSVVSDVGPVLQAAKAQSSHGMIVQHLGRPQLQWQSSSVVIRSLAVVLRVDPLQVVYHEGAILRSSDPTSVQSTTLDNVEVLSWASFEQFATDQGDVEIVKQVLKPRVKQLTALAVLALKPKMESTLSTILQEHSDTIVVQHLCMDFGVDANYRPWLLRVSTGCPVPPIQAHPGGKALHKAMTLDSIKLVEQVAFASSESGTWDLPSLLSSGDQTSSLSVLIDQVADGVGEAGISAALDRRAGINLEMEIAEQHKSDSATHVDRPSESSSQQQQVPLQRQGTKDLVKDCPLPTAVSFIPVNRDTSEELGNINNMVPECQTHFLRDLFSADRGVRMDGKLPDNAFAPSVQQGMKDSLDAVARADWTSAVTHAKRGSYQLCWILSFKTVSFVWLPEIQGNANLAIKVARCGDAIIPKDLIIEIPHPYFDRTRAEGIQVFARGIARTLIMSGSHRCAMGPESGCTGSIEFPIKTNCASHSTYRNTDVAHSVSTLFFTTHVHVTEVLFPADLVVSLHTTRQLAFVVSDGTSHSVEPNSAVAVIGTELHKLFPQTDIKMCNQFPGTFSTTVLTAKQQSICGATNVQGRHLNGSPDSCHQEIHVGGDPLVASGRFVHIEQPVELVKQPSVASTVANVLVALNEYFEQH